MFFNNITNAPAYDFTVVICVTLSIVLHELGHGFAAIESERRVGSSSCVFDHVR
jgi:hypothetical protein